MSLTGLIRNGFSRRQAAAILASMPAPAAVEGYPIAAYGFKASSVRIEDGNISSGISPTTAARVWVPGGTAITKVGLYITDSSTAASGESKLLVWNDDGTLAGATATDTSIPASTGWKVLDLAVPIAAQDAGRFVYVGYVIVGSSPNIMYSVAVAGVDTYFNGPSAGHYRAVYNGGTTVPSPLVPSSMSRSSYIPVFVLA